MQRSIGDSGRPHARDAYREYQRLAITPIAHPALLEADPRTLRPTASIRYTTEQSWTIVKRRWVRHGFDHLQPSLTQRASRTSALNSLNDSSLVASTLASTALDLLRRPSTMLRRASTSSCSSRRSRDAIATASGAGLARARRILRRATPSSLRGRASMTPHQEGVRATTWSTCRLPTTAITRSKTRPYTSACLSVE
jgi:hypothetical protein